MTAYRFPRRPLAASLLALCVATVQAAPFTYHGDLLDAGEPAEGRYDLRIRAFADAKGARALGEAIELPGVKVVEGRFSVELELPDNPAGSTYVEVAVRAADAGDYVALGEALAVPKADSACPGAWALDGNTGVPADSFLGLADPQSATPLQLRARNVEVARFTPLGNSGFYGNAPAVRLGAPNNAATAVGAAVGGGGATATFGGAPCPGCNNVASGDFSTVAGGIGNAATGHFSVVSGGANNQVQEDSSTIAGGFGNQAQRGSAVGGGFDNRAPGTAAMVPGGQFNCSGGDFSLAAGRNAQVRTGTGGGEAVCPSAPSSGDVNGDEGTFVWADTLPQPFVSGGPNQFLVRADGGVGINAAPLDGAVELTVQTEPVGGDYANLLLKRRDNNDGILLSVGDGTGNNDAGLYIDHFSPTAHTRRMVLAADGSATLYSNVVNGPSGVKLEPGAGAWSSLSDRTLKTAIEAVDAEAILDALLRTPIATWRYKAQQGVRHIGPMAQDFAANFAVGENDTTISTVDADGVALAAIQGLDAKLARENAELRAALAALSARLARLEAGAQP